jgi:hypothetical protein
MATKNNLICDGCNQPIDTTKGRVSLQPLRGGLTLVVDNGTANAGVVLNRQYDFCDEACLAKFAEGVRAKIVAPAPATKTEAA